MLQRKTVSLVTFFSFITLIVSSVVLYFVPEGRVAYWADWKFLWLSKSQWGNIHTTGGLLFIIAGIWHMLLNWKPMIKYMKQKASAFISLQALLAILLTAAVYVATLAEVQPMKQLIVWGEQIKDKHAATYGDPPYGHAELSSLARFCSVLQIDADQALTHLQKQNLKGELTLDSVILDIAKENNTSPQQVFTLIRQSVSGNPYDTLPPSMPEGTGKKSLADFCAQYGIDVDVVLDKLKSNGIDAKADDTFTRIASNNGLAARDVYSMIRD